MVRTFFRDTGILLSGCITPRGLVIQALAIVLTIVCVLSGLDWEYFLATRTGFFQNLAMPAALAGMLVPIIVPVAIALRGLVTGERALIAKAEVAAAAEAAAWIVAAIYKALTGRIQPPWHGAPSIDNSHAFHFGFWEHGIFWGWPSSHTIVAVAMTVALWYLFPRRDLHAIAVLYAACIALGVSVSIHWFSDALAAGIFGTLVGMGTVQIISTRPELRNGVLQNT